ncbi:hypothetical protein Lal_00026828 [Lupinus albus]|nr:hypothetical protein Lal_00026828 [Lupinus albus]
MREVGIGTRKIFGSFAGQCGGYLYIGFSKKDMYNQIQKQRIIGNGDAKSALQYLKEQSKSDCAMYWRHSVDEEVVAFDAKFGRNKYKFPVVIFSGVNHHKQTIMFVPAVVLNVTDETYVWLLEKFLDATNGKQPKFVITDGDLSMKNAIKRVFLEARHRLCAWHICSNAGEKIKKNNFHKDFQKVMYVDIDIDDFNMMWDELIAKHGLRNNAWVAQIFDCRSMWARGSCCFEYTRVVFKEFRVVLLEGAKLRIISTQQTSTHVLCKLTCKTEEDISEMLEKVYNECSRLRLKQNSSSTENVDNATEDQIRDPVRVRAKGRVPGMRSRPK